MPYTPVKTHYNVKNMPLIYCAVWCVADRVWWATLCQKFQGHFLAPVRPCLQHKSAAVQTSQTRSNTSDNSFSEQLFAASVCVRMSQSVSVSMLRPSLPNWQSDSSRSPSASCCGTWWTKHTNLHKRPALPPAHSPSVPHHLMLPTSRTTCRCPGCAVAAVGARAQASWCRLECPACAGTRQPAGPRAPITCPSLSHLQSRAVPAKALN